VNAAVTLPSDLQADDYLALGVAACFRREESELLPIQVLEPIPSAYLESVFQGVPTSYQCVLGATVDAVLSETDAAKIAGMPEVRFCENFRDRVAAAARTFKSHPEAQSLVPVGETRTDINHSTEKKRVLNLVNVVKAEDNIRQHEYTHRTL